MKILPIFKYPSTIMWVDDDALFLRAVSELLKDHPLKTLSCPNEAVKFLNTTPLYLHNKKFLRSCQEQEGYDLFDHKPVDLDSNSFLEIFENNNKSQEVSVLIIDFNMPGINGLAVCKQLAHHPCKKVLITGEVSYHQAVQAFNEGIIDRFIRKDGEDFVAQVQDAIATLTKNYFIDNAKRLLPYLEIEQAAPITDTIFMDFFTNYCQVNNIKEYTLLDKKFNFLLVNNSDEKYYFITHTDLSLNEFIDLHKSDPEVSLFVEKVKQRQSLPFFGIHTESWQYQADTWPENFYPANYLAGSRNNYYWHVIKAAA